MTIETAASILTEKYGHTWAYWFHTLKFHPAYDPTTMSIPDYLIINYQ